MSAYGSSNASRRTYTTRSRGDSDSSTTSSPNAMDSDAAATSAGSGEVVDRLGEPLAGVRLAARGDAPQPVQGEAAGDGHQERPGIADRVTVGACPSQPRVLDHVLGVHELAQHPVGE